MTCQERVYQWTSVVQTQLPVLSKPQATVLALWSLGIVLTRSCALSAVTLILARGLEAQEDTVRQRLREWYWERAHKRGRQRAELDVTVCFAPLLRWVLTWWDGPQVALALDATSLGDRFAVLAISVLYRGSAIPVAWVVVAANRPGAWKPHWLALFDHLADALPTDTTVLVLADRGLYARWLYQHIVAAGWHPLLRLTRLGTFCPQGQGYLPLAAFAPAPGTCWAGAGTAFKRADHRLPCTLLARWEEGYADPWLLLTDLSPTASDACWYGLRTWIEHGFKLLKSDGWQWQRTRMTDPARATRLWLALAVATLWLLSVGGEADAAVPPGTMPDLDSTILRTHRRVSISRRGYAAILWAILTAAPFPSGRFVPEPWPCAQLVPPLAPTSLPGLSLPTAPA